MSLSEYTMKDIYEGLYDGPHATPPAAEEGAIFLGIKNITPDGHIDFSDVKYIGEEYLPKWTKRVTPRGGDIVFSYEATLNLYAIIPDDFWGCLGRRMALIRPDENKAHGKYLYYYFFSPEWRATIAENTIIGATVDRIPIAKFPDFPIKLPEIAKQRKIAEILSKYDDLIENNQKQIKLLEEAAQRLYKEWFVDLRFPGYEESSFIEGLPEGWTNVQLDDVLEKITTGLNPRKNFVLGNGRNYYVTIKNMRDNNVYLDDKCDKVDDEAIEKINKRSNLEIGDILFSGIGTMGRVYLVCIPTDNWNVSESVFTLRANKKISKELLYLLLLSDDVQNYCDLNAHGAAQRGIRMADLKAYRFNLPTKELIDRFTSLVTPFINRVQKLRHENLLLQESRDRLLPQLMSGEIDV